MQFVFVYQIDKKEKRKMLNFRHLKLSSSSVPNMSCKHHPVWTSTVFFYGRQQLLAISEIWGYSGFTPFRKHIKGVEFIWQECTSSCYGDGFALLVSACLSTLGCSWPEAVLKRLSICSEYWSFAYQMPVFWLFLADAKFNCGQTCIIGWELHYPSKGCRLVA